MHVLGIWFCNEDKHDVKSCVAGLNFRMLAVIVLNDLYEMHAAITDIGPLQLGVMWSVLKNIPEIGQSLWQINYEISKLAKSVYGQWFRYLETMTRCKCSVKNIIQIAHMNV